MSSPPPSNPPPPPQPGQPPFGQPPFGPPFGPPAPGPGYGQIPGQSPYGQPPARPVPAQPSGALTADTAEYERPTFHVARHAAKAEALDREDLEPPVPPEIHRAAIGVRIVVAFVIAIAIGTIGLLGGFERQPNLHRVSTVSLGDKISAGTWDITIDAVKLGTELHGQKSRDGFLIEVDVTAANNGKRSWFVTNNIKIVNVDGIERSPASIMLRDERLNSYLQPGLPEKLALIWEVPAGKPRPAEVKLEVWGTYPRPSFLGILDDEYDAQRLDALLTIPVRS